MARSTGPRSPALELRPPLLGEGLHALLIVLAVEAVGDQLVEHRQVALVVGLHELVDGGLRGLERAQGVLRTEVSAGSKEDLLRVRGSDELHQLFHALVVVAETEARRRDAEASLVGGEAHVTADGDADAAADAI